MIKMKEEVSRHKNEEQRKAKEIAQLRKEQRQKENQIRNLEAEKKVKDTVLKRKQEEVQALRKMNRPMSDRVAGRVGKARSQVVKGKLLVPFGAKCGGVDVIIDREKS